MSVSLSTQITISPFTKVLSILTNGPELFTLHLLMVVGDGNRRILVTTKRGRERACDVNINSYMREGEGRGAKHRLVCIQ